MSSTPSTPRRALLGALLIPLLLPAVLFGQGCVIARGGGGAMITDGSGYLEPGHWQVNTAYRYFKSHRHFAGDDEQTHRSDEGTEVYNNSSFLDVTATYAWSRRLNLNLTLPFVHHDRSSLYEHLGNSSGQRFTTSASGLADLRAGAAWWVFDPNADHLRGNLSVGFGFKAPTGDQRARDSFMRPGGPTERFVDSSIQPGDGGWGWTIDLQGFVHVRGNLSLYGNGSYLFNPAGRDEETRYSIPDAYLARGGLEYRVTRLPGLAVSLGGRIEGVPGNDAFGSSIGSRRPGFAVAVEPGFTFSRGRFTGTITLPVAVHRNRTTTYGSTRAGDAAFADWTLNTSFTVRL